jgi:hypothetical protein
MFVFGVIAVSFVVLVFPYRLIWHNFAEVATLGGSRCYVLGMQEQLSRVLLYCPTDPAARVKEVARSDVQLAGIRESIYTRPDTR